MGNVTVIEFMDGKPSVAEVVRLCHQFGYKVAVDQKEVGANAVILNGRFELQDVRSFLPDREIRVSIKNITDPSLPFEPRFGR